MMRRRATSAVERPVTSKLLRHHDRRNNKEEFVEEKLEKYRVLLEREYDLRSRMLKNLHESATRCANSTFFANNEDWVASMKEGTRPGIKGWGVPRLGIKLRTFDEDDQKRPSCCDCGRQRQAISPSDVRHNHSMQNIYRHIEEDRPFRTHTRPLSADNVQMKDASSLRKIMAEEKATRRRESIRSLEQDFARARSFIKRSRNVSSNDSLNDSLNESNEEIASSNESLIKDSGEPQVRQRPVSSCV